MQLSVQLSPLLVLLLLTAAEPARGNELEGHPSPYLSMHGQDPVAWRSWGRDAIERARTGDKLLLISSGYFSCHWCHVMQKQSYRNPEIAEFLNTHFVAVKVDRELQPSLDAYLIEFVRRTQGHAGWPLNAFLTPEGFPLAGITYLPPDEFLDYLKRVQALWDAEKRELKEMARHAAEATAKFRPPMHRVTPEKAKAYMQRFVEQALELADELSGGFNNQAKFPAYPQLRVLLWYQGEHPKAHLAAFLRLTLDQMAKQGLRDQIGGGFFRYTVDPDWQVPHFEKMLYDNALLADLYLQAARVLNEPFYEAVARDTLDFLLREMWDQRGAFISSLSAVDDDGVEGGYYLWSDETLRAVLDEPELTVARTAWGLQGAIPFEGGHLPRQLVETGKLGQDLKLHPGKVGTLLSSARRKLLAQRANRSIPRDAKLLAGWNGLALATLTRAAALPGGEIYRDHARKLRNYLVTVLWDERGLARARHGGNAVGTASLEDYAYVARGLLGWTTLLGTTGDNQLALLLIHEAWRRFHSGAGWRPAENSLLPFMPVETILADSPLPSPSATLLDASLAVTERLDAPSLREMAMEVLERDYPELRNSPFNYASHLAVLNRYSNATARISHRTGQNSKGVPQPTAH